MRKDNTFQHGSMDGRIGVVGWWVGASVTFRCHLQPTSKKCALLGLERGVRLAIHFFAPFVISLRRRRRRPILKTAKRKFMFQCFLPPLPLCIRQTKRLPPPSISSTFPLLDAAEKQSQRSSTLNLAACERPHRQKRLSSNWKLISGRVMMR